MVQQSVYNRSVYIKLKIKDIIYNKLEYVMFNSKFTSCHVLICH